MVMQRTRGCGTREKGGVYAVVELSNRGVPLERFIVDPPFAIDADALGLTPVGVKLVEREGVWHIMDWIGGEHYPNVADFVEEVGRMGLSRRIPRNLSAPVLAEQEDGTLATESRSGFELLTRESRILLVHSRAVIRNHAEMRAAITDEADSYGTLAAFDCPRAFGTHIAAGRRDAQMCAGLWWEDVEGGEFVGDPALPYRLVDREMPSFTYRAKRRPDGFKPDYAVGIVMALPVQQFVVIADPEGGTHETALERLRGSSIPVSLQDS